MWANDGDGVRKSRAIGSWVKRAVPCQWWEGPSFLNPFDHSRALCWVLGTGKPQALPERGVSTDIKEQSQEKIWKPHPCLLRARWENEECTVLKEISWQPWDRDGFCLSMAEVRKRADLYYLNIFYRKSLILEWQLTAACQKHSTIAECPSRKDTVIPMEPEMSSLIFICCSLIFPGTNGTFIFKPFLRYSFCF